MPFGVTAAVTSGLVAAGVGEATAGILAAGLVDAGTGALIGGGISALTGGNVGHGAAMGALGGAVAGGGGAAFEDLAPETAASFGLGSATSAAASTPTDAAANIGTDSATAGTAGATGSNAAPLSAVDAQTGSVGGTGNYIPSVGQQFSQGLGNSGSSNLSLSGLPDPSGNGAWTADSNGISIPAAGSGGGQSSTLQNLGNWASKNPLQAAVLGNVGLTAAQSLFPKPPVNVGQNAANTLATNPNFNASLPQYSIKNTATPYTGNWYTYGQNPETALYNGQPVLQQAQGGLVTGYAKGGTVKRFAAGGQVPMPQQNPLAAMAPQPAQPPMAPAGQAPNPLATANGFNIGKAIGQHLQASGALGNIGSPKDAYKVGHAIGRHLKAPPAPTFNGDGQVSGPGGGQDDAVPARLSQDEYVVPSDVVSHLGDGSSNAGGKALDHLVHQVRVQKAKAGSGFPPKAHNPLSYLPKKPKA